MPKKQTLKAPEPAVEMGLPPLLKLVCLWLFLLPALILWFVTAKSHGWSDQWAAYLPLLIIFAALAFFLNGHSFWQLSHRLHVIVTLALASVLAFAMGLAGLLLVRALYQ